MVTPANGTLDALAEDVRQWTKSLTGSGDVEPAVRSQLLSQLTHLAWLIDNADKFGVSAVVRAADEAVGDLTRTVTTIKDPEARTNLKTRLAATVVVLGLVAGGLTSTQLALEAGVGSMTAVSQGITVAEEIVDKINDFEVGPDIVVEPRQIESGPAGEEPS